MNQLKFWRAQQRNKELAQPQVKKQKKTIRCLKTYRLLYRWE